MLIGGFTFKDLDDLVAAALMYYGEKNVLDNTPLPTRLEKDNDPRLAASPLKFPGKLAIDTLNNRLFISDSNHNRIVCLLNLLYVNPCYLFLLSNYQHSVT